MTEETIQPPRPFSVNTWKLPSVLRLEGDGRDPRKNRILDDRTGEEVKLPIQSLQFNMTVDQPNSIEMVLGEVAVRATIHHVQYHIDEEDLTMLAKQNGFEIVPVPAYPARMVSYGPAEIRIIFRDLPDFNFTHPSRNAREAIEACEPKLREYVEKMNASRATAMHSSGCALAIWPSAPQENEFMIWAHKG